MNAAFTYFEVHRSPNGKFYMTREDQIVRTRLGGVVLFDTEQDAIEFLAEVGDVVSTHGRIRSPICDRLYPLDARRLITQSNDLAEDPDT